MPPRISSPVFLRANAVLEKSGKSVYHKNEKMHGFSREISAREKAETEKRMSNRVFVVSGPSGAGIGEILSAVFAARHDLATVTPVTARKMKAGEVNGVGFYFFDLEQWNEKKASGDLLETTEFAGNDYGTSRALVEEQLAAGKSVLLNLELSRAAELKRNLPEAVCLYIEPSPDVLRCRYEASARSSFEVSVRMEAAEKQRALSGFCDAHINSDDLQQATAALCAVIDG